ncbi:MAG: HAMP domain-containing protein [Deltaproteobacteria bacterium]|nr:HAMP domain-containing protein [Candidatus Anaeroferrophillacea bacterium]
MTLKKRILIGYGISFCLMGLVTAWAVTNLVALSRASEAILSENYRSILAAGSMIDALERQDSGVLMFFLGNEADGTALFRDNEAVFLEWLGRARDNVTIAGEEGLIGTIDTGYSVYRKRFSAWTDARAAAADPASPAPLPAVYRETIHPLFRHVRNACIDFRRLNEEAMYATGMNARKTARRAIWSTSVVSAAALAAALFFSIFLAERIARPLRHFMAALRRMAAGEYAVRVPVDTGDELGRLADEFNRMSSRLQQYHEMDIDQIIAEKNKGEAILSGIADGLVVFDPDLRATAINPAARQMLGLTSPEASPARGAEIIPDPELSALIRQTVENGFPPEIPEERRIIRLAPAGRPRHCLFSITTIRGRDGGLSGIVLLLRDVTRLKEVEQLKNEFFMAASHELRTPLTSLEMSVGLLREHAADMLAEKDRDLLDTAHEEVRRMKNLVGDLLDISRMESGSIKLEFEPVPVVRLFEHVQTIFHGQFAHRHIDFAQEVDHHLPDVRADANKITWVLTNLISNALRYVPESGRIRLAARHAAGQIELSVHDNGPGIPPEYQAIIFRKFVQVKGREAGGAGLGLAICREIVRAHGGTIRVESAPGAGSTFRFTLPPAGQA